MAPGRRCSPVASSVARAGGMASAAPTAATAPSLMAREARKAPSGVTSVPPVMARSSTSLMPASSQHSPAAVDRQIGPGDLARDVARQEQASVGDIRVQGDALQGVLRRMALCRLLDRDAEAFG